jgi:carbon monoxide dehydrogenase subunit G
MEIRNTFDVDAPPERVFDALVDLERVGPAIPGATIGAAGDDGAHAAQILVKLGPMRMTYAGTVRIVERDDAARRAVLSADVKETRGQGSARATMSMQVDGDGRPARVDSLTEVQMTGRAASMGRGIIEDVATRLVAQMAENLAAQLAPAPEASTPPVAGAAPVAPAAPPAPAPAVNGIALLLKVLRDRIARALGRRR